MAHNQIPVSFMRHDGDYINMLNRYGTMQDNSMSYDFQKGGFIPDMMLTDQYEENGLFAKIIDIPAEEAIKHGFDLGLKENCETGIYITEMLEYLEFEEIAAQAIKWSRLFGGALGVMLIDDGRGIDEPLDWKSIKGIEEIRLYERAIVYPDYASLMRYTPSYEGRSRKLSRRYGVPERYHINSIYEQFWVHESRCLIFRNGKLPERTMQAFYRTWGLPEYIRIRKALREAITSHSTGVKMLERCVQPIYGMKGLADTVAGPGGRDLIIDRLTAIDLARHILNSIAIDADGETYDFKSFPLAGVHEVIEAADNMLSAVSNIPATKLFGRSPDGMNATGHSDMENWYSYVDGIRNLQIKPNLQVLIDVIIRGGIAQGEISEEPDIKLKFNPLWSMSDDEEADIAAKNAGTQQTRANTAKIYVDMGALDPSEVRSGLAGEGDFQIEELLDNLGEEGDLWGSEDDFNEFDIKNSLTSPALYDTMINNDTADEEWKTINGTPVPVGEDGELKGAVGNKIQQGAKNKGRGRMLSDKDKQKYEKRIVGQKTSTGLEITGFDENGHTFQRIAERGISPARIENMIAQEPVPDKKFTNREIYWHEGSGIVIDTDTGVIITTMWRRQNK